MKNRWIISLFVLYFANPLIHGDKGYIKEVLEKELAEKEYQKKIEDKIAYYKKTAKIIDFKFDSADLVDVINYIAAEKGANIIFPLTSDAIKAKLTINLSKRLSVDDAWDMLQTILNIAGYSIISRNNMKLIVKNTPNISRESLPIFVGVSYEKLPDTDEKIIYLTYLENIQVQAQHSELDMILRTLLPKGEVHKTIPQANGIIIIERANCIRSVMHIITELDKVGFKEKLEVMSLHHTSAKVVADLFTQPSGILGEQVKDRFRLRTRRETTANFFDTGTKIIAHNRTNSLILLGREQALIRIKSFINKYIDIEMESGKSVLHTYQLRYLDASVFAKILRDIVTSATKEGVMQARGEMPGYGPERFFEGVVIQHDRPEVIAGRGDEGKYQYSGSNSLIIAAKNDDWIRIRNLIGVLDQAQPQVVIEILIVDLTMDGIKELGSQIRNPALASLVRLPKSLQNLKVQSAQLAEPIIGCKYSDCDITQDKSSIAVDLMKPVGDKNQFIHKTPGSTLISLNDETGETWSILHVLSKYEHAKILSHPYVVAMNNKEAIVDVGEDRWLPDTAGGTGSTTIRYNKAIDARLLVKITPRIGARPFNGDPGTVNLEVNINIDEFSSTNPEDGGKVNRQIITNAHVKGGSILALGGLIKAELLEANAETPILGRIPILGWLFKSKGGKKVKNNLTVFIRPTIVLPTHRVGMSDYTNKYIGIAKKHSSGSGLFDGLRDPITRWFFKTDIDTEEAINIFTTQDLGPYEKEIAEYAEGRKVDQERQQKIIETISKEDSIESLKQDYPDNFARISDKNNISKVEIEEINKIKIDNHMEARFKESSQDQLSRSVAKNYEEVKSSKEDALKRLVENEENPLLRYVKSVN